MKHLLTARAAIKGCAIIVALAAAGCATVPPNQAPVVRAEQTLSISLAAIDSFLAFEHRRRADLPAEVRDIAARVRAKAPAAFDSANRLRLAYKLNRTAGGKASLLTALGVVDALVGEIRVWIPRTVASQTGATNLDALLAEAAAYHRPAGAVDSWVALVPVFVDLAREIYAVVMRVRAEAKQSAEWSLAEESAFAERLAATKNAIHWK